jgi:hypothetical protein
MNSPSSRSRTIAASAAVFLAAIVSLAGVLATAANASGPVITFNNDPAPRSVDDWADCAGFQIDATFMAQRRNETFYDSSGQPVLQRRHVQFTGTLFNAAAPSKSVTYTGDFTRTFDFTTGDLTLNGLDSHAVVPGGGVIELNAGDTVVSATDVVFHGPDGDVTELCNALS